ncbi:hypothetical protein [Clostridium lacusfryxellense]|uniref:hypothetical protein n=1 Tax=Clostridium lacusfryxellense TaxID=205328 RepID=UPI001C0C450D|nr:hypothetical protein [Clostridium lacusfryxellense]MBU3113653.1 hypothetical protein [Clostridium lacusfryxellense]
MVKFNEKRILNYTKVNERDGEKGYLYNVHYPINPENFEGKSHDWIAILKKQKDMGGLALKVY